MDAKIISLRMEHQCFINKADEDEYIKLSLPEPMLHLHQNEAVELVWKFQNCLNSYLTLGYLHPNTN